MKRFGFHLLALVVFTLASSLATWYFNSPPQKALMTDEETRMLDDPQPGDLYIMKDSLGQLHYWKVKELNRQGQITLFKSTASIPLTKLRDLAWVVSVIQNDASFTRRSISFSQDHLKSKFERQVLIDVFRYGYHRDPWPVQIVGSLFGFGIISIVWFLIIWLIDVIDNGLQMVSDRTPNGIMIWLSILLVVSAMAQITHNAHYFQTGGIAWLNSVLSMLPVATIFHVGIRKWLRGLSFANQEFWKFVMLIFGGICFYLVSFYLSKYLQFEIISEGDIPKGDTYLNSPLLRYHLLPAYLWWSTLATGNFLNNLRKRFLKLRRQEAQLQIIKQENLAAQAELKAMQARVNPHFLYNALNSIASLATIDAQKTEAMALSLADFYKYSTNRQEEWVVPFIEELEMVRNYLRIEQIRFGDQLSFELNIDELSHSWQLPRFLLQPLVENAVKYGFDAEQAHIRIILNVHGKSQ